MGMPKRIELSSVKHYVRSSDSCYRADDGVIYRIVGRNQFVEVCSSDKDITEADLADEVVIDGKLYPVLAVGGEAFRNCPELTTVAFPASLKKIGNWVFYDSDKVEHYIFNGCRELDVTSLPNVERADYDSLNTLMAVGNKGKRTFVAGEELTDIVVPEGTKELPDRLLDCCESLRSVTLPDGIETIGFDAFRGCKNLTNINLPEGLKVIGYNAFYDCINLEDAKLPSTLTVIGSEAFSCTAIESIVIPDEATVYHGAFRICSKLKSVKLPSTMTEVPDHLFDGCCLLNAIEIPQGVTQIGDGAFWDCKSVNSLQIPEGVTAIGSFAFAFMPITTLTIPAHVMTIGEGVFEGCAVLSDVYSKIENPSKCDVKSFELTSHQAQSNWRDDMGTEVFYRQATLHVPNAKGIVSAYKKKAAWKKFSKIVIDELNK
jgi:hypothetical protein